MGFPGEQAEEEEALGGVCWYLELPETSRFPEKAVSCIGDGEQLER
jgi:hypothetical protein